MSRTSKLCRHGTCSSDGKQRKTQQIRQQTEVDHRRRAPEEVKSSCGSRTETGYTPSIAERSGRRTARRGPVGRSAFGPRMRHTSQHGTTKKDRRVRGRSDMQREVSAPTSIDTVTVRGKIVQVVKIGTRNIWKTNRMSLSNERNRHQKRRRRVKVREITLVFRCRVQCAMATSWKKNNRSLTTGRIGRSPGTECYPGKTAQAGFASGLRELQFAKSPAKKQASIIYAQILCEMPLPRSYTGTTGAPRRKHKRLLNFCLIRVRNLPSSWGVTCWI